MNPRELVKRLRAIKQERLSLMIENLIAEATVWRWLASCRLCGGGIAITWSDENYPEYTIHLDSNQDGNVEFYGIGEGCKFHFTGIGITFHVFNLDWRCFKSERL